MTTGYRTTSVNGKCAHITVDLLVMVRYNTGET